MMVQGTKSAFQHFSDFKRRIDRLRKTHGHFKLLWEEYSDLTSRLRKLRAQPGRIVKVESEVLERRTDVLSEEILEYLVTDRAA